MKKVLALLSFAETALVAGGDCDYVCWDADLRDSLGQGRVPHKGVCEGICKKFPLFFIVECKSDAEKYHERHNGGYQYRPQPAAPCRIL